MKTIIGQVATGEFFFPRVQVTEEIWEKLDCGAHILLVAPRRVGKTSILRDLEAHAKEGYQVMYFTCESAHSIEEFFESLFKETRKALGKSELGFTVHVKKRLNKVEKISAKGFGVTFEKGKLSYREEFIKLLESLNGDDRKFVIIIDEFAQAVENIIMRKKEKEAIRLVEIKREIRQVSHKFKKVQFIYAGSIGLENTVEKLGGINYINDLTHVVLPELSHKEARELTEMIIDDSNYTFEYNAFEHLIKKIDWLVPYYFQIALDEIHRIMKPEKNTIITKSIINEAIENSIKKNNYFAYWHQRLKKAFRKKSLNFARELLNIIAKNKTIKSNAIYDLAVKNEVEASYKGILNILKHDGYINNEINENTHKFNSPLLREWWNRNVTK